MGNTFSCCLGPRAGLIRVCRRQKVAPCCESETQSEAAVALSSTTAEPATSDSGVVKVQDVQPITNSKRRKGLAGRAKSWMCKTWNKKRKCKKICSVENEAPVQDPEEYTTERMQEEMSPDIENATGPVEFLRDCILECSDEEEMPSDLEKPPAQYHHRPVEFLRDCILEYSDKEEMPSDLEHVYFYLHREEKCFFLWPPEYQVSIIFGYDCESDLRCHAF
nr:uncharacterized protein C22orf42-like isoform X2 [Aotus nancymaae]